MKIEDLENKEFILKFTFEKLTSNFLYLQKILKIYPKEDSVPHKNCVGLIDSLIEQLSKEELEGINSYFSAIALENSLEDLENET